MLEDAPKNDDLHPSMIDLHKITDPKEKEQARAKINAWSKELFKQVGVIFANNGVETYVITFMQKESGLPLVMAEGRLFDCALCSVHAARKLRTQVDEKLAL
jgi:hypothetical protein